MGPEAGGSISGSQNWMMLRAESTRGKDVQDEVGKAEEKQHVQGLVNPLKIYILILKTMGFQWEGVTIRLAFWKDHPRYSAQKWTVL